MICWDILGKCCNPIPQRLIVATLVMSGLAIQYIHRLAFNLTITEITVQANSTVEFDEVCQYNETTKSISDKLKAEFHWSSHDQAHLLGAFYVGYIVTHLPGGVLADKYGPKRVLGYGVVLTAICSLVTPWAARLHVNWLVAVRAVMGLAQGPVFPALSVFVARWSLPHERNIMSAYMSAGVVTGAILANLVTGLLLYNLSDWDRVFYIYVIITVIWYFFWIMFSHDSPSIHPFITEKEKTKINEGLKSEITETTSKPRVPYWDILKSVPVWTMISVNCGHDWAFYITVNLLPQYMSYVLRFNIKENGFINCLPYIGMVMISMSTAKLAEVTVTKGWLTKTVQCKIYAFIANLAPCLFYILASYAGCNRIVAVGLFTAAMAIQGMVYSSIRVVNVDMSPNFAGLLMSMLNGIGAICGFLGPKLFAVFTEEQTVKSWRTGFFVSTLIIFLCTVVFLIWGTSKVQPWNFPRGSQSRNTEDTTQNNQSETDKM